MKINDLRYECFKCGEVVAFSRDDNKIDGTSCNRCGGQLIPKGYTVIGIDLASGPDMTYSHRDK